MSNIPFDEKTISSFHATYFLHIITKQFEQFKQFAFKFIFRHVLFSFLLLGTWMLCCDFISIFCLTFSFLTQFAILRNTSAPCSISIILASKLSPPLQQAEN